MILCLTASNSKVILKGFTIPVSRLDHSTENIKNFMCNKLLFIDPFFYADLKAIPFLVLFSLRPHPTLKSQFWSKFSKFCFYHYI